MTKITPSVRLFVYVPPEDEIEEPDVICIEREDYKPWTIAQRQAFEVFALTLLELECDSLA